MSTQELSTALDYQQALTVLLGENISHITQSQKERRLLPLLNYLHQHHQQNCPEYSNIVKANQQQQNAESIEKIPFLAVRLFKQLFLSSIDSQDIYKVLKSSGTTGQTPAQVVLDKATSSRQSKALVNILQDTLGKQRLPMLIIDSPNVLSGKGATNARGAGIQGLAFFGRDHTYALDENMQPDWPVIQAFAEKYGQGPVLIFGFTFMLWVHFIQALRGQGQKLNFPKGTLLHSGGWKKLESEKIDNREFKTVVKNVLGVSHTHNFYGMAEQVGSIFVECSEGHLHAPLLADVIVRNPYTLDVCEAGEQGLLQVLSALPTSYPGHSILTEDLGVLLGVDDCPCGKLGKYFRVDGRLPKTEIRGCSDTHTGTVS